MIYPPQWVKRWWGAWNSFGSVDRVGCPVVWSMVELCLTHGCKKYCPELYVQAEKFKLLPILLAPHSLTFTATRKYLSSFFLYFPFSLPFIAINVCYMYMVLLLQHAIKIVLFAAIYISCYRDLCVFYVITSNVMLCDLREIKCMLWYNFQTNRAYI